MGHLSSAKTLKGIVMSVLTDSRAPVQIDGSGQTDRHSISINSCKVACPEFLSWDISRRGVVGGRVSLIIRYLCPRQ